MDAIAARRPLGSLRSRATLETPGERTRSVMARELLTTLGYEVGMRCPVVIDCFSLAGAVIQIRSRSTGVVSIIGDDIACGHRPGCVGPF